MPLVSYTPSLPLPSAFLFGSAGNPFFSKWQPPRPVHQTASSCQPANTTYLAPLRAASLHNNNRREGSTLPSSPLIPCSFLLSPPPPTLVTCRHLGPLCLSTFPLQRCTTQPNQLRPGAAASMQTRVLGSPLCAAPHAGTLYWVGRARCLLRHQRILSALLNPTAPGRFPIPPTPQGPIFLCCVSADRPPLHPTRRFVFVSDALPLGSPSSRPNPSFFLIIASLLAVNGGLVGRCSLFWAVSSDSRGSAGHAFLFGLLVGGARCCETPHTLSYGVVRAPPNLLCNNRFELLGVSTVYTQANPPAESHAYSKVSSVGTRVPTDQISRARLSCNRHHEASSKQEWTQNEHSSRTGLVPIRHTSHKPPHFSPIASPQYVSLCTPRPTVETLWGVGWGGTAGRRRERRPTERPGLPTGCDRRWRAGPAGAGLEPSDLVAVALGLVPGEREEKPGGGGVQ